MNKQQRGAALTYIAAFLADMASRSLSLEDIELLAAFAVTFADNLALVAESMQKGDKNNEEVFVPPSLII